MAHQLCQDPAGRVGVEERDLEPEEPLSGLLVDERHSGGGQPLELAGDVVDLEGEMVHPGAPVGEESPDGRLRAERGEQLDPALADPERHRLDALVGNGLAMLELRPEETAVRLYGGLEVLHGHADVMDPSDHARDAIGTDCQDRSL